MKVTVIKFAGETGLRRPGTIYEVNEQQAALLCQKGLAVVTEATEGKGIDVEAKEDKTPLETKELKLRRNTKRQK